MSSPLKIVLFLGSVREGRLGLRVAKFMVNQLKKKGHEVSFFDPVEMPFTLLHRPIFMYKDKAEIPAWLKTADEQIRAADAYVVVSAEYNHSIPPALSNMLDHFGGSAYAFKPSGIVTYSAGQYGGMRAAMQLRAMLGELGMLSVSNIFGVPVAQKSLSEDGEPLNEHMERGADRLISQLDWYANALRNHRNTAGIPS
ncbi:Hypp8111 [Branchiostoma lanceolatum]|uniref:Hypp8111 protein n=1 Tax=Branchiostoma lanceolatum TaxID=7740 RepID=A0A8K0EGU2_BRALA|nr:Hypp8111 [Branchiostoma lanceolatum]